MRLTHLPSLSPPSSLPPLTSPPSRPHCPASCDEQPARAEHEDVHSLQPGPGAPPAEPVRQAAAPRRTIAGPQLVRGPAIAHLQKRICLQWKAGGNVADFGFGSCASNFNFFYTCTCYTRNRSVLPSPVYILRT